VRRTILAHGLGISLEGITREGMPQARHPSALAALTVAKTKGPGYGEVASGQEHSAALRRLKLVGQLRDDVASGSVRAFFQPIACIPSGEIAGFEALARWQA
jgi:sensor c-di-GMP phosphodiesterase-like protein